MIQQTAQLVLTITIEAVLTVTTVNLPNGLVGQPYSLQLTAAGGIGPYNWSASGLPAGLTCNAAGLISGTPTAAGSGSVTVSVTDTGA